MKATVIFGVCAFMTICFCSIHSLPTSLSQVLDKTQVDDNTNFKSQTLFDEAKLENVKRDTRLSNSDVIGFTAEVKNHLIDLPVHSTVVFNNVIYNAGNGYDETTGIFTCPRSGLYMFYVNVEPVYKTPAAAVTIKINGSPYVDAVAERFDTGHDSTGGNMIIKHIQEGDTVWVETYYHDNQDLYRGFTSFSGVLIQST